MWQRKNLTLRLGRYALELWQGVPGQLELLVQHPLPAQAPPSADILPSALHALWSKASAMPDAAHQPKALSVVLESAWMPVMCIASGPRLWRAADLSILAKHRMMALYGPSAAQWQVQTHTRAGDSHALAFGLAPEVLAALRSFSEATPLSLTCVQPALIWGFNGLRTALYDPIKVWWLWPEQDRYVLSAWAQGGIWALHPAISPSLPRHLLLEAVKVERERQGCVLEGVKVVATTWDPVPAQQSSPHRMQWISLVSASSSITNELVGAAP